MKTIVKKIPGVGPLATKLKRTLWHKIRPFTNSQDYWINRYNTGGNSGAGSYEHLAEFKAEILNNFVKENNVQSVIEYGCGDGNQLKLADYPSYIGFDVSLKAIAICNSMFGQDSRKIFKLMEEYQGETAALTLSLDVVYHLVEDKIFVDYMHKLFDSAQRFVVIYSSNTDTRAKNQSPHVRHRKFTDWVESNKPSWRLIKHIPNKFPIEKHAETGSFADFYIYGIG